MSSAKPDIWSTNGKHPVRKRLKLYANAFVRSDITIFNFASCLKQLRKSDPTAILLVDDRQPLVEGDQFDCDVELQWPRQPRFLQASAVVGASFPRDDVACVQLSTTAMPEVVNALSAVGHTLVIGLDSGDSECWFSPVKDPIVVVSPSDEITEARAESSRRAGEEYAAQKARKRRRKTGAPMAADPAQPPKLTVVRRGSI